MDNNDIEKPQQAITTPAESTPKPKKKSLLLPISLLAIGFISLSTSIIFLIVKNTPKTADAEYLVNIGSWIEESSDSVIWNFTEIGKGTLTTNNHLNDYDFTWSLDGDTIKISTNWLYTLEDRYTYSLDQKANILTITSDEKEITFVPAAQNQ